MLHFSRTLKNKLTSLALKYPVITLTGPRQSGKTTLCRTTFPLKPCVNLEAPDTRDFALNDPRGFLNRYQEGAIIDEIQRAPDLVSYIQVIVDEKQQNGLFILTGSEQLKISNSISQSLAGRTAILRLLPLAMPEIRQHIPIKSCDEFMMNGGYPRLYQHGLESIDMYRDYVETYIERDVRQLINIKDLSLFQKFVQMCAGRVGQTLNLNNLGNEVGVSHTTAREWISILEASYIIYLLKPYYENISKRLVKSPKLYFYDTGVVGYLLKLRDEKDLSTHPLRGHIFENLILMEFLKSIYNNAQPEDLYFYRDSSGLEVDILLGAGGGNYQAIEIKAAETIHSSFFINLNKLDKILPDRIVSRTLIYGGSESYQRAETNVLSWKDIT